MARHDLIFKINRAVRSIEDRVGLGDLDLTSKEILRFIGESDADNKRIRVTDIIRRREFGTPPTIFSRLSLLERQQWIAPVIDDSDKRVKNVVLSSRARKAFKLMSAAALDAIEEAPL